MNKQLIRGMAWAASAVITLSVAEPMAVRGEVMDEQPEAAVYTENYIFSKEDFSAEVIREKETDTYEVQICVSDEGSKWNNEITRVCSMVKGTSEDACSVAYEAGCWEDGVYYIDIQKTDLEEIWGENLLVSVFVYIEPDYAGEHQVSSECVRISAEELASDKQNEADGYWLELDPLEIITAGDAEKDDSEESETSVPEQIGVQTEALPQRAVWTMSSTAAAGFQVLADMPDAVTGKFQIHVKNLVSEDIQNVWVPVWCSDDQSDIVWYIAEKSGDEYVAQADIALHKYHTGIYKMDVYTGNSQGQMFLEGRGVQEITPSWSGLTASQLDEIQSRFRLTLSDVETCGVVAEVRFAVWSIQNGQDDLRWYTAGTEGKDFIKEISLSDHKGTGEYKVDCYALRKDGAMQFLKGTSFQVAAPSISGLTAEITDASKGEITVKIEGVVSASGVSQILVPVWCSDDQSDIIWYTAEKQGSEYYVHIKIANHQYHTGIYKIHVYIADGNGMMTFADGTTQALRMEYEKFVIEEVPGSGQKQFQVELKGLQSFSAVSNVLFAVWSEKGGQDDLIWYTAREQDGSYSADIHLMNHMTWGKYNVHCYAQRKDGKMEFITAGTFSTDVPEFSDIKVEQHQETGDLTVKIEDVTAPAGVQKILVPIWCSSDQSDLIWYTAEKEGDAYIVETNISRHKYHTGVYQIDLYLIDQANITTFLATKRADFTLQKGSFQQIEVLSEGYSYRARLSGTVLYGTEEYITFAVWSEAGGQDDLIWYDPVQENGEYTADIYMNRHLTTGKYKVDAYARMKDGSMTFLASITFQVDVLAGEKAEVVNLNGNQGMFDVCVTVMRLESQYEKVMVAVWGAEDRSDMRWYQAERAYDGRYIIHVSVEDHNRHFGNYTAHAYAVSRDGTMNLIGGSSGCLTADNYVYMQQVSDAICRINIYGANINGVRADTIEFPTWSTAGNQDDLNWYEAETDSSGNASVTIFRKNHNRDGQYVTHIYVCAGSQMILLKGCYYDLYTATKFDDYAKEVMHNIIYAVETGGQIYGNARYNDFTQAYTNSEKETAITIGAGAWFATEAKRLLSLIRQEDPALFASLDTEGIGFDIDNANWSTYGGDGNGNPTILKGSAKAVCIQNLISTDAGKRVQDRLVDQQMEQYITEAENLGVTDLKGRMFCANIRHLGGYGAMEWVIESCIEDGLPLTMDNLWISMRNHTTNLDGNGVGANKYKSRHEKVMLWLNQYIG